MNFFRRHLESRVTRIIALIIALIFIGWEFTSAMLQNKNTWLMKVGNIEYTAKDWQENYRALTKDPLSAQEALANPQYAKKRVMEEMIRNALILQEATEVGFRANDKMVASEVVNMKIFKGDDGKFDKDKFEKTLKINNMTESEFIKGMKESILRNNLMDIFYNTSGIMGKPTYDLLVKLVAAEQKLTLYTVPKSIDEVKYTEEDLKKFLNDHKEKFTTPDQIKISKVIFNSSLVKEDSIKVTDEEIKEFYDKNAVIEPEKRSVNQIIVPSYNDAKQVVERIKSGKISYDDAAKVYGNQQMIPYEIGPFVSEGFDEDISQVVFKLPEGGISDLVQTPLGWHIFRVSKVYEAKAKDLSEMKGDILQKLTQQKLSDAMHEIVKSVMNDIDSNVSIEDIAKKYSLVVHKSSEEIKRFEDGRVNVSSIPEDAVEDGILRRKIILAAAAEDKSIKMIGSNDNRSFMIINRDEIVHGKLMEFAQVENQLRDDYTNSEIDRRTMSLAKEFRKKVLESDNRFKFSDPQIMRKDLRFSRIKDSDTIPSCITDLIMGMHKNGAFDGVTGVCKTNDSYSFATLNNIDFDIEVSDDQKAGIRQTIHTLYNEMIFDQFTNNLKDKYKVELDDKFVAYLNEK